MQDAAQTRDGLKNLVWKGHFVFHSPFCFVPPPPYGLIYMHVAKNEFLNGEKDDTHLSIRASIYNCSAFNHSEKLAKNLGQVFSMPHQ